MRTEKEICEKLEELKALRNTSNYLCDYDYENAVEIRIEMLEFVLGQCNLRAFKWRFLSGGTYIDINEAISELAETLVELIERDRNYTRIKVFVQNCGNTELQREWDSLTEKEQRAVADELYYHFRPANK